MNKSLERNVMQHGITNYKAAYLSLAIPLAGRLRNVQADVCHEYSLIPRPELHLTLAFFGGATIRQLTALSEALSRLVPSDCDERLLALGLGGAYEKDRIVHLMRVRQRNVSDFPRVFWIAVEATDQLRSIRSAARTIARNLGMDISFVTDSFWPHTTLGSAGPQCVGKSFELWDVHTVEKTPTMVTWPEGWHVQPEKLHLSDASDALADSICLIHILQSVSIPNGVVE